MHPPLKDQADIGVDNPTVDASDSDDNKDMARQEHKNEADVNYMLSRFGVTQPRGTPTFGEWDDTIELQTALNSVREAREAYQELPQALRNKFRSMEDIVEAVEQGTLVITDKDPTPAEPAAPVQPA